MPDQKRGTADLPFPFLIISIQAKPLNRPFLQDYCFFSCSFVFITKSKRSLQSRKRFVKTLRVLSSWVSIIGFNLSQRSTSCLSSAGDIDIESSVLLQTSLNSFFQSSPADATGCGTAAASSTQITAAAHCPLIVTSPPLSRDGTACSHPSERRLSGGKHHRIHPVESYSWQNAWSLSA